MNRLSDEIVRLLIDKAPNWVNEEVIRRRLSQHNESQIAAVIQDLLNKGRLKEQVDQRTGMTAPVRYYRLDSYDGIPLRQEIRVGDVDVPRVLSVSSANLFPEDFNEAVEQLAEYNTGLEARFSELVRKQQRDYWANIVTIFGVFISILALILVGLPKIKTDVSLSFWQTVQLNLSQLLPLGLVLAIFVLALRLIFR